jgi:LmbE family N-acetylglucosaminyl deacetylase
MDHSASPKLRAAVADGAPALFLSAHLDDAILSCGALIEALVPECPVTVATLFTGTPIPPHTYAGRSYLRQCGAAAAATLYAERRAEDQEVLASLGVEHVHFEAKDALYRTRDVQGPVAGVGALVPELVHRYPSYRYDIAKGRISRGDRRIIEELDSHVGELVARCGPRVVFCPIGIGRNVDHLITRMIGGRRQDRVVYYADFPYNLSSAPDATFVKGHRLTTWTWDAGVAAKSRLIRGYRTQVHALFPDGHIATPPEQYFERLPG